MVSDARVHRCPRDKKILEYGHFHDVEIYRCPECQGVLVEQKRLPRLLEEMGRELLKTISIDCPLDEIEDQGRLFHCPKCSSETEHYGFMGSKHVMIDCCKKCSAIWLDTDELGGMSLLHARTQKRMETAEIERKQVRMEASRVLSKSVNLRAATNRGLLLGFILGKLS
jgi:Zn-finger nucleic acid-binding protein